MQVSDYQRFKKSNNEYNGNKDLLFYYQCDDKEEVKYLWLSIRHNDRVPYIKHISKDKDHKKSRHFVVSPDCEVTTS